MEGDYTKSTVIGKPGESFLSYLSDKEVQTLIEWGQSGTYDIIKRILDKIEKNHLSVLIANKITKDSLLELSERRGMHIEDVRLLSLPELAKAEKNKRKTNLTN
jgi:hypothetical protein